MISLPITRHRFWQLVVDGGLSAAAWYLAFRLRFDPKIPPYYQTMFNRTIWVVLLIQLAVFVLFGFYNRWWRYVSTRDMWGAARGVTVACLVSSVVVYFANPVAGVRLPRSVAIMDWLLLLAFVAGARMLARTLMERPSARGLVARGKEVIVIGAGRRGTADHQGAAEEPVARLHADRAGRRRPAQEEPARAQRPRARHLGGAAEDPLREPSGRGADRDPVRVGRGAPARRRHHAQGRRSGQDAARDLRADLRRPRPRRPDPPCAGRGHARPRAGRRRPAVDRRLHPGRDGARHRSRRLDRLGALPPDRAHRLQAADPRRPGRDGALRDRARARLRARLRAERARARRRGEPRADAPRLRALHACGRVPRRRVQARAADGGEPARVGAEQHAGDEGDGRGRGRVRRRALRARLHRQGGQRQDGDGPVEGAVRVDRRGLRRAHRHPDPLRRRSLRQRARLVRQRDPDLPPPDRAGRPGRRHPPGDDALLHDDSRGGLADRPGRVDRPLAARCSCSTWASPSRSSSSRAR